MQIGISMTSKKKFFANLMNVLMALCVIKMQNVFTSQVVSNANVIKGILATEKFVKILMNVPT